MYGKWLGMDEHPSTFVLAGPVHVLLEEQLPLMQTDVVLHHRVEAKLLDLRRVEMLEHISLPMACVVADVTGKKLPSGCQLLANGGVERGATELEAHTGVTCRVMGPQRRVVPSPQYVEVQHFLRQLVVQREARKLGATTHQAICFVPDRPGLIVLKLRTGRKRRIARLGLPRIVRLLQQPKPDTHVRHDCIETNSG
jgi:hypothetical protein